MLCGGGLVGCRKVLCGIVLWRSSFVPQRSVKHRYGAVLWRGVALCRGEVSWRYRPVLFCDVQVKPSGVTYSVGLVACGKVLCGIVLCRYRRVSRRYVVA